MKNILKIDDYSAVIDFDPDTKQFRGEFIDLNGGADFYATSADGLIKEGRKSLRVFLEVCAENGLEPRKSFSGKFILRLEPDDHAALVKAALSEGKSLNQYAANVLVAAARSGSPAVARATKARKVAGATTKNKKKSGSKQAAA